MNYINIKYLYLYLIADINFFFFFTKLNLKQTPLRLILLRLKATKFS